MKKILQLIACSFLSAAAYAQTTLPYSTGFDNPTDLAGWQKFRTGYNHTYQWGAGTCFGAPSAPNCVSHDYPVGGAPMAVIDWYVSPPFDFSGGGKVDAVTIKVFAITGSTDPDDYFGIYLLNGSPNPAMASATLIADLTSYASSANTWQTVGSYTIPATTGTSYIAFKYAAKNNWFVPSLDDLELSGTGTIVCNTPSNILFSNVTATGAKLTWSYVTSASGYEYATTTSPAPPASGTPSTNLSETVTGLSSGTQYYAHARAMCGTTTSGWKTLSFHTAFPAGIGHTSADAGIAMYPNPVKDVLSINGLSAGMYIRLYDVTGRLLQEHLAEGGSIDIHTSLLPAGIVLVNISGDGISYNARLVKE